MLNQIIEKCIAKDGEAQKKLYELYYGKMMATCRRYIKNTEDARDVLHISFMKVFDNIDKYRGDGAFEAWMRRIFVNSSLDFLKKNIKITDAVILETDDLNDLEVESSVLHKLELKEVYQLIDQLEPMRRVIFNMFAIDGYTHAYISRKLNISEGTSKWHVASARRFIMNRIEFTHQKKSISNEQ